MVKIDADKAIELIGKAVEIRGEDYVDPNSDPEYFIECEYATFEWELGKDNMMRRGEFVAPGCIVGTAFHIAGVSVDDLRLISYYGDVASIQDGILAGGLKESYSADRVEIDLEMTDDAVKIFETAQNVQDDNKTWGEAYRHALQTRHELEDTDAP